MDTPSFYAGLEPNRWNIIVVSPDRKVVVVKVIKEDSPAEQFLNDCVWTGTKFELGEFEFNLPDIKTQQ